MQKRKNTSTKRDRVRTPSQDCETLVRFAELLKLRGLAQSTQDEYLRFARKLLERLDCDPTAVTELQLRAHLLRLKEEHSYSPSSMRTAVAAMRALFGLHLGHDWKLFDLVRAPSERKLPTVLTREEVTRLFAVVREERFRVFFRFVYATGLRLFEALQLQVEDLRQSDRVRVRGGKGHKDRYVPLPAAMLHELRRYWKTHRNARWVFPAVGRGWREKPACRERLGKIDEPMGQSSVQHCMKIARAAARLPVGTCTHTLRHSYATHLLDAGVSIRLISAYLGHSSLETTMIYLHLTAVNEASARAAIDRLLPPDDLEPPAAAVVVRR
ncbi:MAG: tyrosine-type recombinase/integrase [Opitutaceae bacterium]|nr:tyrosine-type recombinase/integrase [Opitutaceae bacterium]